MLAFLEIESLFIRFLVKFRFAKLNLHMFSRKRERDTLVTMSNDDLEEGDGNFTSVCDDPMEDDSLPIISILELIKQTGFMNVDRTNACRKKVLL